MDHEVDPIRHQGRQAIARLEAEFAVAPGQRGGRPIELAPGERAVGREDRDIVRRRLEANFEQVVQRRGRSFEAGTLDQHSHDPMCEAPALLISIARS